jgi:hypothetical protein
LPDLGPRGVGKSITIAARRRAVPEAERAELGRMVVDEFARHAEQTGKRLGVDERRPSRSESIAVTSAMRRAAGSVTALVLL